MAEAQPVTVRAGETAAGMTITDSGMEIHGTETISGLDVGMTNRVPEVPGMNANSRNERMTLDLTLLPER